MARTRTLDGAERIMLSTSCTTLPMSRRNLLPSGNRTGMRMWRVLESAEYFLLSRDSGHWKTGRGWIGVKVVHGRVACPGMLRCMFADAGP